MEKTLAAAIKKRTSIRTYEKRPLKNHDLDTIRSLLAEHETMIGPFKHSLKLHLITTENQEENDEKIGTYGFIKNAPAFIAGVTENRFEALIDFGYIFERLILMLTDKGYGTCWLGGTFKRSQFAGYAENTGFIPAVTPVGYPAKTQSLKDKTIRLFAQSGKRKPFESLFFDQSFTTPLKRTKAPRLAPVFDLVQRGPSASNKQPWRFLSDGKNVHVFLAEDERYTKKLSYNIQALDIGIAMAHFEIGLVTAGIVFKRFISEEIPDEGPNRYVLSYRLKRTK